ncbi:MAG: MBL fold metallo-hydrolase [Acidimicrobiales bacterium]|nr:MBL fold metallo-hydrolase [Acidimicrobiales bacterium]MCB9372442.1 MBL fold metallo-hydrolase [Microthrixaceae bacterium]
MAAPTDRPTTRPPKQEQEDAVAEVTEVAPGILRLQLPIKISGLGHVNCYALEDADGFTLVDPGMPGPANWKALLDRLGRAGAGIGHVHGVVVTHSHPDHFGGAGKVRVESGARVITSTSFRTWFDPATEGDDVVEEPGAAGDAAARAAEERDERPPPLPKFTGRETPWGGKHPTPPLSFRVKMKLLGPLRRRWMVPPRPSVRLADAETIVLGGREWVAVHTPGHTSDHLCLYDPTEGVLLAGDHVLPTITPHIAGHTPRAGGDEAVPGDPLADFFDSLDKVTALEGVTTVLPAHGHPFSDLAGRADAIKVHHRERLDLLRAASDGLGEATVEELSHELFRPRSWGPMADSETYAHLEHLRLAGEVECRRVDGLLRYRRVS